MPAMELGRAGPAGLLLLLLLLLAAQAAPERDPYRVLGVGRSSSQADIKKAYKRLARQWYRAGPAAGGGRGGPGGTAGSNASSFQPRSRHPDKNKDPGAEDKFIQISKAYEVRERHCRKERVWKRERGCEGSAVQRYGERLRELGWVRLGKGRLRADLIAPYNSGREAVAMQGWLLLPASSGR